MPTDTKKGWTTPISNALSSGRSAVFAIRTKGAWTSRDCACKVRELGHQELVLRPPMPWAPLAPLQHLLAHWQQPWPQEPLPGAALPLLWLGLPVLTSQLFANIASRLQNCPTLAWIGPEDLQHPRLRDFLRAASQGQLACPVAFVCHLPPDQLLPPGAQQLTPTGSPPREPAPATPLVAHRTARYLAQILFFGDALDRKVKAAMKAVSRADHSKHHKQLRAAGLLDKSGQIDLQRLRTVQLPALPTGRQWRQKALSRLPNTPAYQARRHWLEQTSPAQLAAKGDTAAGQYLHNIAQLDPHQFQQHRLPGAPGVGELRCITALVALETPESEPLAEAELATWPAPYAALYRARTLPLEGIKGCHALRTLHEQVAAAGHHTAAALLALDLAQWQQDLGQEEHTFSLLAPHQDQPHWPFQWRRWHLLAEAYHRMGRQDMARHALAQAVEAAPKPLSPILTATLRQTTATQAVPPHAFLDTTPTHVQTQLNAARDTFRAMGDGRRLAGHLRLLASRQQAGKRCSEARILFAQALALSRQYRDGIGQQAAELKLGLLRQQIAKT